jgi:hypothetical protein
MEEVPENRKESSHSGHANGMELINLWWYTQGGSKLK